MIAVGMKGSYEVIVGEDNTALTMKSGSLDVFATPALIAALEAAAVDALKDEIEEGYTTVGSGISVTHTAPSVCGLKVTAAATVKEVSDRKIVFDVSAKDECGIIGEGEHTRVIVNKEKFMSKATIRSESNVD